MKYNHDRPVEDFNDQLTVIREAGFNPIAVSQMILEDVFVFKTAEEAEKAYRTLERDVNEKWIGKAVGWWHDEKGLEDAIKNYEKDMKSIDGEEIKVKVHWL